MSQQPLKNMAASVRQRLLNLSREDGEDYQKVIFRYAIERLLYRLSRSAHSQRFVLKGATLFALWSDSPHRATRDLDLWSHGESSIRALEDRFRTICTTPTVDDGIVFSAETVRGSEIRIEDEYLGVRLRFLSYIEKTRIPIQVDVGFGDIISPLPETVRFPALLEFPEPELLAYPREVVVAEKFHAMVTLGIGNSRMKDFFDLFVLARDFEFSGDALTLAIRSTFGRRETPISARVPLALTAEFHGDPGKGIQWRSFLRKNRLDDNPVELVAVAKHLREFILPPVRALANRRQFHELWPPAGPWKSQGTGGDI